MKKDTMFFVVEEKERILGYCSMMTVLDEGDILNVAVRSDRQKEGIGQFLVDSMLRMAEMQGSGLSIWRSVRETEPPDGFIRGWDSKRTDFAGIIMRILWKTQC